MFMARLKPCPSMGSTDGSTSEQQIPRGNDRKRSKSLAKGGYGFALGEDLGEEVIGYADGVGDDGEGGVDGAGGGKEAGVDYVEVVELVGFAVDVEDGGGGVVAEAEGAVLVAYAFEGDALFEVGVEGDGGVGVAGLFEDVDPAVFESLEAFGVVGGVGELDVAGLRDGDGGGLVGGADAGVGMRAGGAGLGGG